MATFIDKAAQLFQREKAGQLTPDEIDALGTARSAGLLPPPDFDFSQADEFGHFAPTIESAAKTHGIPSAWIKATIMAENATLDPTAVSQSAPDQNGGAIGLMQIHPPTVDLIRSKRGVDFDPRNPTEAIDNAAWLMAQNLKDAGGDFELATAMYLGPAAANALRRNRAALAPSHAAYLDKVGRYAGGYARQEEALRANGQGVEMAPAASPAPSPASPTPSPSSPPRYPPTPNDPNAPLASPDYSPAPDTSFTTTPTSRPGQTPASEQANRAAVESQDAAAKRQLTNDLIDLGASLGVGAATTLGGVSALPAVLAQAATGGIVNTLQGENPAVGAGENTLGEIGSRFLGRFLPTLQRVYALKRAARAPGALATSLDEATAAATANIPPVRTARDVAREGAESTITALEQDALEATRAGEALMGRSPTGRTLGRLAQESPDIIPVPGGVARKVPAPPPPPTTTNYERVVERQGGTRTLQGRSSTAPTGAGSTVDEVARTTSDDQDIIRTVTRGTRTATPPAPRTPSLEPLPESVTSTAAPMAGKGAVEAVRVGRTLTEAADAARRVLEEGTLDRSANPETIIGALDEIAHRLAPADRTLPTQLGRDVALAGKASIAKDVGLDIVPRLEAIEAIEQITGRQIPAAARTRVYHEILKGSEQKGRLREAVAQVIATGITAKVAGYHALPFSLTFGARRITQAAMRDPAVAAVVGEALSLPKVAGAEVLGRLLADKEFTTNLLGEGGADIGRTIGRGASSLLTPQ